MTKYLFTSESVCAGHPDKICDSISDAILDAVLSQDKYGRVAVETVVTTNRTIIVGEVTAKAKIDYKKIAQSQIKKLGYTDASLNYTYQSPVEIYIHEQSPEIAVGVLAKGAGDQGMMFGYACDQYKNYMPLSITMAHALARRIDTVRENSTIPYLKPDGKTQVTLEYKNGRPYRIEQIVVAVPHDKKVKLSQVKENIITDVVNPICEEFGFNVKKTEVIVNGTGVWHLSGPAADSGLTGRKIVVDTYGGHARIGGGCFSGKDPTKVDRSGAYAARYIAKNIIAQKLATRAEVRLAYFIGAKKPVMLEVESFGTLKVREKTLNDFISNLINTSVEGIIKTLDLRRPIYLATSAYGHFGRDEFPWEKITD